MTPAENYNRQTAADLEKRVAAVEAGGKYSMNYDFDALRAEIDKAAAELNLDPWQALEIWHVGLEVWADRLEKPRG